MNIPNLLNINFSGKVEDKKSTARRPYLAPQKPDTFEHTNINKQESKKDSLLTKISNLYNQATPAKLDVFGENLAKDEKLDEKKLQGLMNEMSTSDTLYFTLERAKYDDKNNYLLRGIITEDDEADENIKLLDKDLNVLEQESRRVNVDDEGYPVSKKILTQDFRTNTFCETKFEYTPEGYPIMSKAVKIKRDAQNRLLRKETYEKSDVEGMFNVKYEFPNGKSRQISKAYIDKNGHTIVEKDMRSSDMTRTQYRYEDDPKGNRIVDYKITTADGKVLMNQSQSFEVLGENKFRSSRNDKTYMIEFNKKNNSIDITDEKKKETSQIELTDYIDGNEEKIINVLKKFPGDELINLGNKVSCINEIENKLDGLCVTHMFDSDNGIWTTGFLTVSDDPFIFLHELGHATDSCDKNVKLVRNEDGNLEKQVIGMISDDDNFKKIYSEESKNFLKEFPTNEREHIDYFLNNNIDGAKNQGKKETVAETNAILNTYQSTGLLGIRTQYLQQHFPKTIAYLSEKLVPSK